MPDRPEPSQFTSADRGQMLQDYTIGISIFIVAVMFVVGTVPTIFTPFAAPVGADQTAQADRVAADVMENVTYANSTTRLDASAMSSFFDSGAGLDGIPLTRGSDVNVTLVDGTGDVVVDGPSMQLGPPYRNHSTAAATRIVYGDDVCSTSTCRIEVRVW